MEEVLLQSKTANMDKSGNVILDIESLTQPPDISCSGSPKMTKALSRKGSSRMDKRNNDYQEGDITVKKLAAKVSPSQLEQIKQHMIPTKILVQATQAVASSPLLTDCGEGKSRRINRLITINPRKILLIFATLSSMGTMILIYFTLAINRKGGA